jgi:sporulation protein YlmC with PRC-barrel domain
MMIMKGPMRVNDITGSDVENHDGESLGTIHDLMVTHDGCVKYAVISYGGFMGLGDKLIVVPWSMFKHATNKFIIDVSKMNLDNAPTFDSDQWPNMTDDMWNEKVDAYYHSIGEGGTEVRAASTTEHTAMHSMSDTGRASEDEMYATDPSMGTINTGMEDEQVESEMPQHPHVMQSDKNPEHETMH